MSCSRPSMWTAPNPLRKQTSCLDGYTTTTTTSSTTKSNYRNGNKPTLQKQMSVDQHRLNGRTANGGHHQSTWSDGRPEASLRIFTAVKKRTPSSTPNCVDNLEWVLPNIINNGFFGVL